jgi:hypothetical protein
MKQTKIIDFFGIQKDGHDAQATKCRLSQGNCAACTTALHNLMSCEMRDLFPSLLALDDP